MSRRHKFWIVTAFVLTVLVGALVNMPVVHLMRWVQLPPGLQVRGLEGTIFRIHIEKLRYQDLGLSDLALNFQPLCLARLQVCYQATSPDFGLLANLSASAWDRSIGLSDSRIDVPVELIAQQFPRLLVRPTGDFSLSIRSVRFSGQAVSDIDANLIWNNAGIEGEQQILGNYSAKLRQDDEGLAIELHDQDSVLSVNGGARIFLDGRYQMEIRMDGQSGLNRSVYSALDMFGQKTSAYRYLVNQGGRLPPQATALLQRYLSDS